MTSATKNIEAHTKLKKINLAYGCIIDAPPMQPSFHQFVHDLDYTMRTLPDDYTIPHNAHIILDSARGLAPHRMSDMSALKDGEAARRKAGSVRGVRHSFSRLGSYTSARPRASRFCSDGLLSCGLSLCHAHVYSCMMTSMPS